MARIVAGQRKTQSTRYGADHDRRTLSSGTRCLKMLRLLSQATDSVPLQQIASSMGLHPTTAHRILATLLREGFVEQQNDRRYSLGLEAFAVGAGFLRRSTVRRAAVPSLMRLAEQTKASVNLAFWHGGRVVIIDCLPMPGMYHFYTETGSIVPAHATAIGKCLLAYRDKGGLEEIGPLHRYTQNTICSLPALKKELERIVRNGYATDLEESIPGCRCIAAPILQSGRQPLAAISISAPPGVISVERTPELAATVREAGLNVSLQLGYQPTAQPMALRRP